MLIKTPETEVESCRLCNKLLNFYFLLYGIQEIVGSIPISSTISI